MGYHFVDRILEVRPEAGAEGPAGARGVKVVGRREPYLRPGPAGTLELPASYLAEAVGQLAAWVAMSRDRFARRPVAGLAAAVEVRGGARPGDLVALEVEIESMDDGALHYQGEARVRGEPVLTLSHAVGPLLPMEDFDDPDRVEREFLRLFRPGEPEPEPALEPDPGRRPAAGGNGARSGWRAEDHPAIDGVIERGEERIVAVTCVSRSAPYLEGHFPRDPVLPATLLFDAQCALAAELAARGRAPGMPAPRVERLLDLKLRGFVRPGSRLVSEVRVRSRGPGRVTVQLQARLHDRAVASGLAELAVAEGA